MQTPPDSSAKHQPGFQRAAGENGRLFALLSYLLPLIGGIIGLALDRSNPMTRVHAQQSIAAVSLLILSFLAWAAAGWLLGWVPFVGPILALTLFTLVIALAIFLIVQWIISLVAAARGQERQIPFANRLVARLFDEAEKAMPADVSA